ncbi:IclR family transcriptional regulator [Citrobacter sp. VF227]
MSADMISTKTPAIDKAARIFHFIAEKGSASYSEVHQNVGLPQSTTSALLASLTAHGFLRQKNSRYFLGLIFYELGNKSIQDFDFRELAEESLIFLRDRTRLACHLGILDGNTGIYLAKKESRNAIIVRSWTGKRLSLHSSSLGKVLLAWLPEDRVDALLPDERLPAFTARTITTRTALKTELDLIRRQGWAFDNQEDVDDVTCIAAPVFDRNHHVVAAISLSGVRFQMPEDKIPEYSKEVMKAAEIMSEKLAGI